MNYYLNEVIEALPKPGDTDWENMIDFMRQDLENDMDYSKLIETAHKNIEADGKDFNTEFKKWKERNRT